MSQHEALQAISRGLLPSEKLFAFLDDIFIAAAPERLAILHRSVETALWDHARIRINKGKTQIWNRAGAFPVDCEHIVEAGRRASPPVVVWRVDSRCRRVSKASASWALHLDIRTTSPLSFAVRTSRILAVHDWQCAWLLFLFCAAARANSLLRVLSPSQSETFATVHDSSVWNCPRLEILGTREMLDRAGLSLTNGGLGLRSGVKDKVSAFWASWADVLPTIPERHPAIADKLCVAPPTWRSGFPHLRCSSVPGATHRERVRLS